MTETPRTLDLEILKGWEGREESATDFLDLNTLSRIRAFFGLEPSIFRGDPVDETWHWCFFHAAVPTSGLGQDGHPKTGDFLPPFDLPRRMWGGSRLVFERPLKAGEEATKTSRVVSVDLKTGKSGKLGLVKVAHEIAQGGHLCRREEQDIVYREAATGPQGRGPAPECPDAPEVSTTVTADPVTLFRYSALTYNAHRIHYDRDYATTEEGYPGLVVHGPLTASLIAGFARSQRDRAPLAAFSFRGTSPLFDGDLFSLNARSESAAMTLWAERLGGGMAMTAEARF